MPCRDGSLGKEAMSWNERRLGSREILERGVQGPGESPDVGRGRAREGVGELLAIWLGSILGEVEQKERWELG